MATTNKRKALVLDVDQTLLIAGMDAQMILVHPDGSREKIPPEVYDKMSDAELEKLRQEGVVVDYSEFSDKEKMINSLLSGTLIPHVVKFATDRVTEGATLFILTARAFESDVHSALVKVLGNAHTTLADALDETRVFAISDVKYLGSPGFPQNSADAKALVLSSILDNDFDHVTFVDDGTRNIQRALDIVVPEGKSLVVLHPDRLFLCPEYA